jgi:tRNA/rRNA methyltransferase
VILNEPQLAENIGAVARVMANFGLADLRLVRPRDGWPQERAWPAPRAPTGRWTTPRCSTPWKRRSPT